MSQNARLNGYDADDAFDLDDDYAMDYQAPEDTKAPFLGALAGGGLAILAGIILIGLTSTIVHRDRTSIPISHLILVIICLLVAAAGIFFMLRWKKSIETGGKTNWLFFGIVFALVGAAVCYLIASGIYVYMYRPFHFSRLSTYSSEKWKKSFIDTWDFEKGWNQDRKILWWIGFFSILMGLGCLVLGISMFAACRKRLSIMKILLAVAACLAIIVALFAIHYLFKARDNFQSHANREFKKNYLIWVVILLFVGIAILVVNLIFNLTRHRLLYFVCGMALVLLLVLLIAFMGLSLRYMRQTQFEDLKNNGKCGSLMSDIHESSIGELCSAGKYLSTNQNCTKNFLAKRWEVTPNETRFLNPNCCHSLSNHNLWPLYIAGCLGLLFMALVTAVIICDFYVGDSNDTSLELDKPFSLIEFILLGIALLFIIVFIFWFIFRPKTTALSMNPYVPVADKNGKYIDSKFTPVDMNKIYGGNPPADSLALSPDSSKPDKSARLLKTQGSILNLTPPASCASTNKCGVSINMLVTNGKIVRKAGMAKYGSQKWRTKYGDSNIYSESSMIYGTYSEVSNLLAKLQYEPINMTKTTPVYMWTTHYDDLSVHQDKLLNGTGLSDNPEINKDGTIFNGSGFDVVGDNSTCQISNSCSSKLSCDLKTNLQECKKGFNFYNNGGLVTVNIPYKVRSSTGGLATYDNDAHVDAFYDYQGNRYYETQETFSSGLMKLKVPKPYRDSYDLVVNVKDHKDRYLTDTEIVNIPVQSADTIDAPQVILLTPSGVACHGAVNEAECFKQQQAIKKTSLDVELRSDTDRTPISGKSIEIFGDALFTKRLGMGTTQDDGIASVKDMPYGRYFARFAGDKEYLPASGEVVLQSLSSADLQLLVHNTNDPSAVLSNSFNPSEDRDFAVNIKSYHNENSCTAEPTSKYCGYMQYQPETDSNNASAQSVRFNQFTESYYLAYKKPSPSYSSTCDVSSNGAHNYYSNDSKTSVRSLKSDGSSATHLHGDYDWKRVRARSLAASTFETLYCFTGWGLNSKKTAQSVTSSEPTAASKCPGLYPVGSTFSLDRLVKLNSQ